MMEEWADQAAQEIHLFFDDEYRFVEQEHDFIDKFEQWGIIVGHLAERLEGNKRLDHLRKLNNKVSDLLVKISDYVKHERIHELHILKEEESILRHLKNDIKHRNCLAAKKNTDEVGKKEAELVRLEMHELDKLHKFLNELRKLLQHSCLERAIELDASTEAEKHHFEQVEEYYFIQIFKSAQAYETVFGHLIHKARYLANKLGRSS